MSKGAAMQSAWAKKLELQQQATEQSAATPTPAPAAQNNSKPAATPKSNTATQNGKSTKPNDTKQNDSTRRKSISRSPVNDNKPTKPAATPAETKQSLQSNKPANDNSANELLTLYTALRGTLVVIQCLDSSVYEGLFHTVEFNGTATTIVLQQCQMLAKQDTSSPQSSQQISASNPNTQQSQPFTDIQRVPFADVIQVKSTANPFTIIKAAANTALNTFATDTQISNKSATKQRELKQYDFSTDASPAASPSSTHFKSLDDEIRSSAGQSFDQFARFQQMTGQTTQFDINTYSTQLDKDSDVYKKNERYARQLAREIESTKSTNVHEQIERGQKPDIDVSEEMLHSTVVREQETGRTSDADAMNGKQAYQPPHQRKSNKPIKQLSAIKPNQSEDSATAAPTIDSNKLSPATAVSPSAATATAAAATADDDSKSAEKLKQPKRNKSKSPLPAADDKSAGTSHKPTEGATQQPTVAAITQQLDNMHVSDPSAATKQSVDSTSAPAQTTTTSSSAAADESNQTATADGNKPAEAKKSFKFNVKAKEFVFGGADTSSTMSNPATSPFDPSQSQQMYMQPDLQAYLSQQQQSGQQVPLDPAAAQQFMLSRQPQSYMGAYNQPPQPYYVAPQQLPQFYGSVPPQYVQQAYGQQQQYVQLPFNPMQINAQYPQTPTFVPMPMPPQQYTPGRGGRGGRGRGGAQHYAGDHQQQQYNQQYQQ